MIRAARCLTDIDQRTLGELVGITHRTVIRLENDESIPTNPRRVAVIMSIRDLFEKKLKIRFVYADRKSGGGVIMKKGFRLPERSRPGTRLQSARSARSASI
jgi:DNA-binding XRE family transcriptional regulator